MNHLVRLQSYLSIFDWKNKRQQPNTILEVRSCPFGNNVPDRYGVWPGETFETGKSPVWFNASLYKTVYAKKKITVRGYKHCESITCLHRGKLIYEWFAPGFSPEQKYPMYSMTKSVVATLLGIAIDQGYISSIHNRVIDYFPEVQNVLPQDDCKRDMTLEHLLSMTSGLRDDSHWRRAEDAALAGFMRPQISNPGERFKYISVNYHVIAGIIVRATGENLLDYANKNLFGPLGIQSAEWEKLPDGSYRGNGGIFMTPHDMLRLGYLWLNYGRWRDKQIVSPDYLVRAVSRSRAPYAFGMPFWNNSWFPFFLFGAYETRGHNGQFISVYPNMDMVIVRTGWPTKRAYLNDRSQALAGASFAIDEGIDPILRNEMIASIKAAGGEIVNSVTENTAFVVVGEKLNALGSLGFALGVPLIEPAQLWGMLI